jgi:hypothetical protein
LKSKYKTPRLWLEYQNSFVLVTGSPTTHSTVIRAVPRAYLARRVLYLMKPTPATGQKPHSTRGLASSLVF